VAYANSCNSNLVMGLDAQLKELRELREQQQQQQQHGACSSSSSSYSLGGDDFADAQGYHAWASLQQAELQEQLRVLGAAPPFCAHLSVEVINAEGFSSGSRLMSCAAPGAPRFNPYCVVWIKGNKFHGNKGTQTQKTAVLSSTASPRWSQQLPGFKVFNEDCVLRLQVRRRRRRRAARCPAAAPPSPGARAVGGCSACPACCKASRSGELGEQGG
jgi:hypothetical protein